MSLGAKSVERNGHLEWKVKFAPGTIEARGTKGNKVVLVSQRETTGPAATIVLRPDRSTKTALKSISFEVSLYFLRAEGATLRKML